MKRRTVIICLLACLGSSVSQVGVRESAGKQEVEKHQLQLDPPAPPQAQKLDPAKLREEADELAKLAESVPADIGQITQGKLPKDAIDRLKRIEKLSNQLRGELTR
jgi:hypothetical protein